MPSEQLMHHLDCLSLIQLLESGCSDAGPALLGRRHVTRLGLEVSARGLTSLDVEDHLAGVGPPFEGLGEGGDMAHGLALALVPDRERSRQERKESRERGEVTN